MSKKKFIILSVVIGVLILIAYRWQSSENTPDTVRPEAEQPPQSEQNKKSIPPPPPPQSSVEPTEDSSSTAGFLPTKMEDPKRFEIFDKHLKEMAQCLKLKMNPLDPQSELSFETYNAVISPELGDIVTQETAWTVSDIRTKSGEVRRIHVQRGDDADDAGSRTLKYYAMDKDGSQKEIPLPKEQTHNPSDSLIASLESDGELLGTSSARLIYYKSGDDSLVVERNGKIYSFELSHGAKVYRCTGADSAETMKCQCE